METGDDCVIEKCEWCGICMCNHNIITFSLHPILVKYFGKYKPEALHEE